MDKTKISDIAKEFDLTAKAFIEKLIKEGFKVSARAQTLTPEIIQTIREKWGERKVSLIETRRGDVLEKRVQTSIIRRRKVDVPETAGVVSESLKIEKKVLSSAEVTQKTTETPKPQKEKPENVASVSKPFPKVKVVIPEVVPPQLEKVVKPSSVAVQPVEKPKEKVETPDDEKKEKEKEKVKKELVLPVEGLAEKRQKAFLRKRAEEFDIIGFSRIERIYQPKKKKVIDRSKMKQTVLTMPSETKRVIKVLQKISVAELAAQLKIKTSEVIKKFMDNGMSVSMNDRIDAETATLIASEYNYEIKHDVITEESLLDRVQPTHEALKMRPPVVTVMGHVDHGKTTLLDTIRKANVAAGEAGGITQHMGAYMVEIHGKRITFIDTPGHEAFSAMRARGAKTTDIVILVVAADDGVMPQTKEAIAHAKAAGVPLMVAINKIDKPGIQLDRIKKALSELELMPEEWGGKTIFAEVSAKNNVGIKELLEMILLQADVLELKTDPNLLAEGIVLEAKVAKGLGPVATVLVQQGTLRRGDIIVSGTVFGKIRMMSDHQGQSLNEAGPSYAVEISGLENLPDVGEKLYAFQEEGKARRLIEWRLDKKKGEQAPSEKVTLEGIYEKMKAASMEELKFVVKADVQGSLEVIKQSIEKFSSDKVKMTILYGGIGAITESDVNLAYTSGAILAGFNIRPDRNALESLKSHKIDLRLYTIIYEFIEDMKKAVTGQLQPTYKEVFLGRAEVRNTFVVSKIGTVAGCMVVDGKVTRTADCRLLRDSKVVFTGKISSLKRFKNDAKEVASGYECGVTIENFNDIKVGDVVEAFTMEEVVPSL